MNFSKLKSLIDEFQKVGQVLEKTNGIGKNLRL